MKLKTRVYHNGDDVFIAWKPDGAISDCRGFALLRKRNGVEEVVSTWVGFKDDVYPEGTRRASTNWPWSRISRRWPWKVTTRRTGRPMME